MYSLDEIKVTITLIAYDINLTIIYTASQTLSALTTLHDFINRAYAEAQLQQGGVSVLEEHYFKELNHKD